MRRPIIVAFESVATPQDRLTAAVLDGEWSIESARKPARKGVFWCAADKPIEDDSLRLAPVHRTSKLPEGAECEECGIAIAQLQQMMGDVLDRVAEPSPSEKTA